MGERTVMFESWRGLYADSPRVLSELLASTPGLRRRWVSTDGSGFPADVATVRRHSPAYFAALLSADVLVANDVVSKHLVKGPRVRYVQMWHGTPLKLIGHDERAHAYAGAAAHLKRMDRDVAKWDHLVSPSPACSEMFRSAFRYDGEIWETGYPRNDVLRSPEASRIRAEVRRRLHLDDATVAVLHAPTWRDDSRAADGGFAQPEELAPAALVRALPEGARLLVRHHRNLSAGAGQHGERVLDVSDHPEIAELYLAADVLVSDYSSAVYDFAVTGKPVVLFAPDLERYRDAVRGMYFDYEDWAPGPVTRTVEELGDRLAAVTAGSWVPDDRYTAFVARFCPHEDGHAGERVAKRLLSLLDR